MGKQKTSEENILRKYVIEFTEYEDRIKIETLVIKGEYTRTEILGLVLDLTYKILINKSD